MTVVAIACAAVAAFLFSRSVGLQHDAVRAAGPGRRLEAGALGRVVRSRAWLGGTALGLAASGLHLVALSLAPLAIVQPIGVLSLVLTVVRRGDAAVPRVRLVVGAVCAGIGGFVVLSAGAGWATGTTVDVWPGVLAGAVAAVAGLCCRGRYRCLGLSTAAAVLFGLGSAVMRAAFLELSPGVAAQGLVLLVAGGWLLHQAYAAGPAAVVVGATTVLDPLTAVVAALALYGESPHVPPAIAAAQAGLALLAVTGVLVLARSVPDRSHHPTSEEPTMPGQRILIGADTFPPDVNGASFFAGRLAEGLAARGHDVHVLCPRPHTPSAPSAAYTVHHARSVRTPFHPAFRISTPGRAREAAGPLLDRLCPDVVHVQSHFAVGRALLAAARERGIRTVATNHFMPENLLGYATLPGFVSRALIRLAWRDFVRIYRTADVVTTPTPRAAELLDGHGLPNPALVVSNGINVAHYAGPAEPSEGFAALFVGRLDAEKNIDELLRAIAPLPGVRAEIVGDGTCRDDLVALAGRLGIADRVRFHGFVPDGELVRIYRSCHVFCMPGTAELQSLATMEAMAAGLPVVAADAVALPHLVEPGRNGFLYPPGDVGALRTAIARLAAGPDQRAAMGEAGRAAIARHDIATTLDRFEELYGLVSPAVAVRRVSRTFR
ncbi:glycosyltransferase [Amycolatopsis sp. NPDC051128]|uniref:glycosyltransferase n=1 Tax=Amycolatopsis sp. NPDC051128 TaxID=3155412 RepID=UPI00341A9DFF